MKILLTFVLCWSSLLSFCQVQKGDFLIRGSGSSINSSSLTRSASQIQFDLDVGYFIDDHWMAGVGLDLSLNEFTSFVGNNLFARYYFRDTLQQKRLFFLEAKYERIQFSPIRVGQSNRRFNYDSWVISCGLDYFLSKHLAIEAKLDYYFLNILRGFDEQSRLRNDFLTFNVALQYFFRYRDYQKERLIDYRPALEKGTWFIGGRMSLQERNQQRLGNIQSLHPLAGKFIQKNWAIGSSLNYTATSQYNEITIGIAPFTRYYFNVGRKKKVFANLETSYALFLKDGQDKYTKKNLLNYGASVGWSNFINKDVSFDIIYSIFQNYTFNNDFSEGTKTNTEKGLSFVIQYYF